MNKSIHTAHSLQILMSSFTGQRMSITVSSDEVHRLAQLGAIQQRKNPDNDPDFNKLFPYETTKLGHAWVQAILKVPVPRVCFVDVDGTELKV